MTQLVFGPELTAHDLLLRAAQVYSSSSPQDRGGVAVEVVTQEPYNVTVGVVTAVGYKFGDVLLTVEPTGDRPTRDELVDELVRVLEQEHAVPGVDHRDLAERLFERGVLPSRAL